MKNKKNLITLGISIVCMVVSYLIYYFAPVDLLIKNTYICDFVSEALFAICGVISLFILKKADLLKFTFKGFGEGLATSGYILALACLSITMYFVTHVKVTATPVEVVFFALYTLMIGVAEEIAFRGIFQNAIMDLIGRDSVKKIRLGIVITGLAFGMLHLTNGFSSSIGFSHAAIQAVNCACSGMIFATAYYRSHKNLWVVIILHAVNDALAFLAGGALSGSSASEVIGSGSTLGLLVPIVTLIAVMWIMRKKKIESAML